MLIAPTQNVIRKFLHEESEHQYLRSCSHDCRVHPRNRYVTEHNLTEEEVAKRLQQLTTN